MFRGLLFEADAESFRKAGIRIGVDQSDAEKSLLEEAMQPFPLQLRNEALNMARIYTQLYCFENSIRELIKDRLQEKFGSDWWNKAIPVKVKKHGEDRQKEAVDQTWLEGVKTETIAFVDFGHLADIIVQNWEHFSDLVPSQHWLRQRMDELEKARHFIAHHRFLLPSEFARIEMYIADWNKQVGF